jgi:hypothetical protein
MDIEFMHNQQEGSSYQHLVETGYIYNYNNNNNNVLRPIRLSS